MILGRDDDTSVEANGRDFMDPHVCFYLQVPACERSPFKAALRGLGIDTGRHTLIPQRLQDARYPSGRIKETRMPCMDCHTRALASTLSRLRLVDFPRLSHSQDGHIIECVCSQSASDIISGSHHTHGYKTYGHTAQH